MDEATQQLIRRSPRLAELDWNRGGHAGNNNLSRLQTSLRLLALCVVSDWSSGVGILRPQVGMSDGSIPIVDEERKPRGITFGVLFVDLQGKIKN